MSAQYYEQNRGDLPPEALNSQPQPHGYEQNRGNLPSEADTTSASSQFGHGTDVMGAPVNPLSEPTHATSDPASAGTRAPPSYDYATQANSADASQAPTGNFPTTHLPKSAVTGAASSYEYATPADSPNTSQAPAGNFPTSQIPPNLSQSGAASQQQPGISPYVQTPSVPGATGKTPMDSIMGIFNKFSKRAEDMTGNVWGHLRTGPNVADTAMGRLALGTRAISEGGLENVYRQTFEVGPDEHLLKTYACYLSTSTGPVAGTLYISTQKLAFCSDRPLAIPASPGAGNVDATNEAAATSEPTATKKSSAAKKAAAAQQQQQQQQQVQHCYYKVMVPISQVESVNPSENTKKKPVEKYIQVKTSDGHEFWFMGFVNYDKGVKNLQETLLSRNTNTPSTNTTSPTTTTPGSYNANTDPNYNTNTPGSYNTNTDPTYNTNTPSSYNTNAPRSYNTNTDPTYTTNTPGSYNTNTDPTYNTNTHSSYNTNTPSSYNTNTDPTYNTNTPSSYNTHSTPPSNYNTNPTSTNTTTHPSYNNTNTTASPVV